MKIKQTILISLASLLLFASGCTRTANKTGPLTPYPEITSDIEIGDEASSIGYMIKGMPIPPSTAMKPIGKGEKIVLDATNTLYVRSDTTESLDVILSLVEIV